MFIDTRGKLLATEADRRQQTLLFSRMFVRPANKAAATSVGMLHHR